jgi:hypothetical protein
MGFATDEPEQAVDRRTLFALVRKAAEFFGIVAGISAGFLTLSFAIGYLATRAHNETLGLPTTTTAYSEFAATGALFFPRTIEYAVDAVVHWMWTFLLAGALVLGVFALIRETRRSRHRTEVQDVHDHQLFASVGLSLCLIGTLLYLPWHVAPLDPANRAMLFVERTAHGPANRVHMLLRAEDGASELGRMYGLQFVILFLIVYAVVALRSWYERARQQSPATIPGGLALTRPILYILLAAMVLMAPVNYGILGIPPIFPCVVLTEKGADGQSEDRPGGYLSSDLSNNENRIVVLTWDNGYWTQRFYDRSNLHTVSVRKCLARNPLSKLAPPSAQVP